jgi:archaellum component FlaC
MKKVIKKKEMTIDDLAMMTQRGFDGMHTEMGGLKEDMKKMDTRLERIEQRVERIEQRVNQAHDARLDKLDDQMRRVITIFEKKLSISFPK